MISTPVILQPIRGIRRDRVAKLLVRPAESPPFCARYYGQGSAAGRRNPRPEKPRSGRGGASPQC